MPKKSTTSKRANTFKRSNKRPQWQLPLLAVLVAAAVGFGIFVVFFSKAGTTSPQVYLATSNNSSVATVPNSSGFTYGNAGDKIIACDWDGRPYGTLINGATVAAYRPSTSQFLISNNNASVNADPALTFQFGDANSGDVPLCGNWDGSKTGNQSVATVGIYRPATATFYLASTNAQGGGAVETFVLGNPGDVPIACDWNGDGVTDLGLFRPSDGKFYMALRYGTWGVFRSFKYGNAGYTDYPVCGNWDGSAANDANSNYDTVGMYRTTDAKFYLRNTNAEGPADIVTPYGSPSDKFVPLVGNWTGTNQTFIGAYRQGVAETVATTPTNSAPGSGSTATPATIDGDANTCATKTLRQGNKGTCIAVLQDYLALRGRPVAETDRSSSTFGQSTFDKVKEFQYSRSISVDGIVGSQTWGQLKTATTAGAAGPAGPQGPGIPAGCPGSAVAGPPAPGACDSYISSCTEKNLQTAYYETLTGQIAGARRSVIDTVEYIYSKNINFKYDWYEGFQNNTSNNIVNARDQNSIVKAACARQDVYGTLTAIAARKRFAQAAIDIIYRRAQEVCVPLLNLPKAVSLLKNKEWYYE